MALSSSMCIGIKIIASKRATKLKLRDRRTLPASLVSYAGTDHPLTVVGMNPLTKLAIKLLDNTPKNIDNTHLMCLYIHRHCFGHSFYGKAHGARAAKQYCVLP